MLHRSRVVAALAFALTVLAPLALADPRAQDCNLDGIPDSSQLHWLPVALADDASLGVSSEIDVLSNDALVGGYYGGVCLSGVCNNCGSSTCGSSDTVVIVNGPQHGNSSMLPNIGTPDHGKIHFTFSDSGTYCGHYEYLLYRWRDSCGMQSPPTRVRIAIPCSQSDLVASLDGSSWLRIDDLGVGSNVDLDAPFTVECWVKPASATGVEALISKWGDAGVDDRSYIIERWSTSALQFGVSGDGPTNQHDGNYHTFFSGTLQTGVWQHVACTYDGAFRRTYLNGVLVGVRAATGNVHQGDTHLAIGAKLRNNAQGTGDVSEFYHGLIDRVRIWNTALSADRIQLSMNVRFLGFASSALSGFNPVSAWEFDSANGHDSFGHSDAIPVGNVIFLPNAGPPSTLIDCNGNGLPDYYDIYAFGGDLNQNGVLDSCEYSSLCWPANGGTLSCPCSNPPAANGRGCDNSSATGGAKLDASGAASLLTDDLVFAASALKPTATCTVWQSTGTSPTGIQMGQGVRCGTGTLKRLYAKTAVNGVIQAPAGADPHVSARSASLGDPLFAGQHRYYFVSYRDPGVLGGCSSLLTFNVTQMLDVVWTP